MPEISSVVGRWDVELPELLVDLVQFVAFCEPEWPSVTAVTLA